MRILDKAVYVGPSLYAHFPVIRLDVDLGELEEWPSGKLGRRVHRRPARGAAGAAGARLLLRQAGRVRPPTHRGRGHLDGPHPRARRHRAAERRGRAGHLRQDPLARDHGPVPRHLPVRAGGRRARGGPARRSCCSTRCFRRSCGPRARYPQDFDFAAERDEFIRFAQRRALGPSTMSLVRAAEERKIPWIRLNEQSLIQFGHGRYQQRIQATVTSRTPHIAVELASDKEETNRILGNLGLPVPRQRLVQRAEDAVSAAERIGYPVVVKPFNANHGRGISIHLTTPDEVRRAFEVAREHSRSVIVESFITGEDHRMLVINGELIAVAKRVPGHVVGDGVHTIEQLVEKVNRGPAPRHRPREGAHPARPSTTRPRRCWRGRATRRETRSGRGRAGLPPLHRQPLDRRHRDRPHRPGPSRQRRDGGARGEGDRARRRRRGLPHHRRHRVLQGSGRRHLRGQRGAGVPHAHGAERGTRRATWPAR